MHRGHINAAILKVLALLRLSLRLKSSSCFPSPHFESLPLSFPLSLAAPLIQWHNQNYLS